MSVETLEAVHPLFGLIAEFDSPGALVHAARKVREAGFRKFDAFSPMPIHELDEAMELKDNRVSLFTLIGGIVGACTGFGLASWVQAVALPLNIGGRPLISVPMFIPVTFELTILFGGLTAAISMIMLNGLPSPYHPVFNVERFANASRSKFFLVIESADLRFDYLETVKFLESLNPEEVAEVAR
jgi:hypothetical protein